MNAIKNTQKQKTGKPFIVHCPKCHGVVVKQGMISDIDGVGLEMRCPHCHANLKVCLSKSFDVEVKEVKTIDDK